MVRVDDGRKEETAVYPVYISCRGRFEPLQGVQIGTPSEADSRFLYYLISNTDDHLRRRSRRERERR